MTLNSSLKIRHNIYNTPLKKKNQLSSLNYHKCQRRVITPLRLAQEKYQEYEVCLVVIAKNHVR